MKLLWVKSDFLHPPDRGAQIRTLEMLKRLHRHNTVHYMGLRGAGETEGPSRAHEYSSRWYEVEHFTPDKTSPRFAVQLIRGVFDPLPVAVARFRSAAMRRQVEELTSREKFDAIVCDFLFPAANMPDLSSVTLFQHNVEATIWKRRLRHASSPIERWYVRMQAHRMEQFERSVCRAVRSVIAVSEEDADVMRREYGTPRVSVVPTGVDIEYFARRAEQERRADLVFVGSMDWMPNIDGVRWFVREILPLIRRAAPGCRLAIAGRRPARELKDIAAHDPGIILTGTVPDIRPWLWGSAVSIVPLRIGGGTRIKIYEAMAAGTPVVSTTVGAEGLDVTHAETILLADKPGDFAAACTRLLRDRDEAARISTSARERVAGRHSWEAAASAFERILSE